MNGRERVFAAINHQVPDRVPVGGGLIDERVRKVLHPNASLLDFLKLINPDLMIAYRSRCYDLPRRPKAASELGHGGGNQ